MKVKVCPKCRSTEIEDVTEKETGEIGYFPYASPRLYKCIKCNFANAIFPEIEEKELKKIFENKSTNKNDYSTKYQNNALCFLNIQ
ncbi:hypothetical protein HYT91_00990 [Candidatus Pacearchaeota archaeon]|nr:hypothetical protein [Candidatus Pacearchaeota archaeon]